MLISTISFGQDKPKSMRELRDSIFTVMKLSDLNRQKMHVVIAESGKGRDYTYIRTIKNMERFCNIFEK
jgi:hypothetical protein